MDLGVQCSKGKVEVPVPRLGSLSEGTEALHKTPLRCGILAQIQCQHLEASEEEGQTTCNPVGGSMLLFLFCTSKITLLKCI